MGIDKRKAHHLDWYLIINGLVLFGIGTLNMVSATSSFSSGSYTFIVKQLIAFGMGLALIFVILRYDYRVITDYWKWYYFPTLIAVTALFGIGAVAGGARRWFSLGFISIQPSEFMKMAVVLCLAYLLYEKKKSNTRLGLKEIAVPMLYVLVPFGLIMKQPDLGTALIVLLTAMAIFWFVGMKKSTYATILSIGIVLPVIAWKFLLKDYQKNRVYTWLNIDADPSGVGYHAKQAMIAVGSGKFTGKGFMEGTQHKLQFIPEHHTDFIYTVIGEEWGFIGSIILFLLFISFVYRCLKVSQESGDELGSIIAFGVATIIYLQFTINVLMAVHLAPVVGIPLPFISYGGSSLLSVMISMGFLLNISMRRYMF